jgi:AmmeMemoRadiSam system protein B
MPVQGPNGQQAVMLGISDSQQISNKVVAGLPAFQTVLPMLDGVRDVDQIITEVGRGLTRPVLEKFIAQLDDAGLLAGPVFDRMLAEARARFDESDVLPPGSTADFAEALVGSKLKARPTDAQMSELGSTYVREQFDAWIDEALKDVPSPSLDALPKGIVAPHLDYPRGWINYAGAYGRLRVVDAPDRVVVLGTNHFGFGTGVVVCDKGYRSVLGTCELDGRLLAALKSELGSAGAKLALDNRYDHENEHSIELQIPWIQHVFGDAAGNFPKVLGVLVHDPSVNDGLSYDGAGLDLETFVGALRRAIAAVGGRTLVVCSSDLSHCGPAFGDQQRVYGENEPQAEEFRNQIAKTDQDMLGHLQRGDADGLVGAMAWQSNPTRWCSVGNLVAGMKVTGASKLEILRYNAAIDQQGTTFVSSISGTLV